MNREPRDTMLLFARQELDYASSAEFIAWATQALVDGFDGTSLRLLAGLDLAVPSEVRREEVDRLHQEALQDLGVVRPSRETALRWHFAGLVRKIVSGECTPQAGLDRIHREIITPLNHPEDMRAWCYLWSGLSAEGKPYFPEEQRPEAILRVAADWIDENDS